MARKSVIEEPEYHGRGEKSTKIYYNLIIPVSFSQSCWRLQGFPIRKNSTIKDTSIWQRRFIRTSIISQLFQDLDLTVKENVSQDLKRSQISQNSTHLSKLNEIIKLTMNLFSCDIEKSFYLT